MRAYSQELGNYSNALMRTFRSGNDAHEAVLSIAAAAAKTVADPSPGTAIGLSHEAAKGSLTLIGAARRWWYRRKVALITRTIDQTSKAQAMQSHLRRLFQAELSPRELASLKRASLVGHESRRA